MASNPVGWFEIYVDQMARAKAFYQQVFALELEAMEEPSDEIEMWLFPGHHEEYGASGALVKMADCSAGGNSTVVYFSCDDCAVQQQRAAEAGGAVVKPKFAIGKHGFIALVRDTEGNLIGLHSMS
ncbi:VOC family protein [Ferrimonas senticii]|uniref:VOC family protein n=1 Tax=Ferrimonas senticii TaxID=394566 RepID=UPI0003FB7EEB|nr:VOC family protein [Ferrimonas senticii]